MTNRSRQELARQGDTDAIAELIQSHTPFRQTKVKCKSSLTRLEIEIESSHVFTPQLCVNEVIHILNKLTPKNINRAVIGLRERGTHKAAYVKYLVLSKEGFEEAKGQANLRILVSLFLALTSMSVVVYFALQSPPQPIPAPSVVTRPPDNVVAAEPDNVVAAEPDNVVTRPPDNVVTTERYQRASLRQSKMKDWSLATHSSRLTAAAEMVALAKPSLSTSSRVRPNAQDLKICIDTTWAESSGETREWIAENPVADIAVLCMVMMKWLPDSSSGR